MAGEELSAGPATRNYEPLYFCGDASLSNQAVGMERHISFIFSFILSKHSLRATGESTSASQCVFALFIDSSGQKHHSAPKIPEIAFLLHRLRTV